MNNKENKEVEQIAEFGVDSRYASKKEYESEAVGLMESRLKRMKNLSEDQIIRARLMQLKLNMENYLKQAIEDDKYHFSNFLKTYIDILYSTRTDFAKDLTVTPIKLSQIINKHREPSEEFLKKLMIHSEKVFENISDFDAKAWIQVYFHEKIYNTMSTQDKWRAKLENQVNFGEALK